MGIQQEERLFEGVISPGVKLSADVMNAIVYEMANNEPRNASIPVGYTYLGQMIAHDLIKSTSGQDTLRLAGGLGKPRFQLDLCSLYGDDSYLRFATEDDIFILGRSSDNRANSDVLRAGNNAIIAEVRNDQNYLLSQMHLFWQKVHNMCVEKLFSGKEHSNRFDTTRTFVTQLFNQIVVEDYLSRVLNFDIYNAYFEDGFRMSPARRFATAPIEFSHSAFRFGHSMVRQSYELGIDERESIELKDLIVVDHGAAISSKHLVKWSSMFGTEAGVQSSSKIDLYLANLMVKLPTGRVFSSIDVARKNLLADVNAMVPSAGQILAYIECFYPESYKKLAHENAGSFSLPEFYGTFTELAQRHSLTAGDLPLWLYILMETEAEGSGHKLGRLGSIIVAESMMSALDFSYSDCSDFARNITRLVDGFIPGPLKMKDLAVLVEIFYEEKL